MRDAGVDDDRVDRLIGSEAEAVPGDDAGLWPGPSESSPATTLACGQARARFARAPSARPASISIAVTSPLRPTISARMAL
jgi:hypothetical protein